jgi:O-antigen ligase
MWAFAGTAVARTSPVFQEARWSLRLINLVIIIYVFVLAGVAGKVVRDARTVKRLLTAMAIGAAVEAVVIAHDSLGVMGLGSVWFTDYAMHRMRGTFRASGQLGQYGMAALFLCYAFAAWPGLKRPWRVVVYGIAATSGLGAYFAARRSAVFCILLWGALLAVRSLLTKSGRKSIIPVVLLAMLVGVVLWQSLRQGEFAEFSGGQFAVLRPDALGNLYAEGHWFRQQVSDGLRIIRDNPLLGCGIGHAVFLTSDLKEIHNGYLSLLVETGVIGAILFALPIILVFRAAWSVWRLSNGTPWRDFAERLGLALVGWIPFSIHNRLWRDRAFWLAVIIVLSMEVVLRRYRQQWLPDHFEQPGPESEYA